MGYSTYIPKPDNDYLAAFMADVTTNRLMRGSKYIPKRVVSRRVTPPVYKRHK